MIRTSFWILFSMIGLSGCESRSDTKPDEKDTLSYYQNPVFEPTFADPTIVETDSGFFAYATQDFWGNKDHLVPVIFSRNLTDWEYIGDAFTTRPSWKQGGIWAPNVFKHDGHYFMFYSLSVWGDANPGIGIAVSDAPAGPFADSGKFFVSSEAGVLNSIDPFFYKDPADEKLYIFWGSFHGIYGREIVYGNRNFELTGEKFQIAGNLFEGTYLYYKDGYYYFFGSCGSCCEGANSTYHVRVGRSRDIGGPYLDPQGKDLKQNTGEPGKLLIRGNSAPDGFAGPGHNAEIIIDNEGTSWLIYHAIEKENDRLTNGATRRPLMIDRMKWFEGWPAVEYSAPSVINQEIPEFEYAEIEELFN
jgi:arabinan endo-1,5-alpha-L-arabinosidase